MLENPPDFWHPRKSFDFRDAGSFASRHARKSFQMLRNPEISGTPEIPFPSVFGLPEIFQISLHAQNFEEILLHFSSFFLNVYVFF